MKSEMTVEEFRALPKKRDTSRDVNLNEVFATQLMRAGIIFEREFRFHDVRKWRMDFHIPMAPNRGRMGQPIVCDLDGGTFSKARLGHNSGSGIQKGFEKRNAATLLGFAVLQFDRPMVCDGIALLTVQQALGIGTHKNYKEK